MQTTLFKKKIAKTIFIISLFTMFVSNTNAQTNGKIEIITEPAINDIVQMHVAHNRSVGTIDGFRIQIFYDSGNNSKSNAYSALSNFRSKFPDIPAYLSYNEPNYKVRVGNFRTRLDAQRFFQFIVTDFSMSYIVKDDIKYPSLEKITIDDVEIEKVETEEIEK